MENSLLQELLDWCTLSNISGVASIIGLFLTIYVFLSVKKIENEFLFRVRLPSLQKKIQQHASNLSTLLQNYPESKNEIIEELSIAKVNINSLHKKSTGSVRNSLKKLETKIEEIRKNKLPDDSKHELREIYLELNMVIEEITNLREDDKWRQRGG